MKTMKEYISTAEGINQMWEKINEVLDGFDFTSVVSAMEALDWTWVCSEGEADLYETEGCRIKKDEYGKYAYFPEYPQLMRQARRLLVNVIKDMPEDRREWFVATGGFKAKAYISTDEERADYYGGEVADVDDFAHSVDLTLEFIVSSSESY